jgi:hypothetical protein
MIVPGLASSRCQPYVRSPGTSRDDGLHGPDGKCPSTRPCRKDAVNRNWGSTALALALDERFNALAPCCRATTWAKKTLPRSPATSDGTPVMRSVRAQFAQADYDRLRSSSLFIRHYSRRGVVFQLRADSSAGPDFDHRRENGRLASPGGTFFRHRDQYLRFTQTGKWTRRAPDTTVGWRQIKFRFESPTTLFQFATPCRQFPTARAAGPAVRSARLTHGDVSPVSGPRPGNGSGNVDAACPDCLRDCLFHRSCRPKHDTGWGLIPKRQARAGS